VKMMLWVWVELFHSDKRCDRYSEHDTNSQ
jgi:hypothetical protein